MKQCKYTSEGMNLLDLLLTEVGSVEGLSAFLQLNPHINPNGIIAAGTEYIVDSEQIIDANVVSYLSKRDIRINTGDVQIPSPPSNLSVRQGGIGELILNWSDNSQSKYGFEVYRRRKGAIEFVRIAVTEIGVSNYLDTNLGHGITYEYQVKIADFAGAVEYSNIAEGTTISADLQFFASKPSNISHSGTGEWSHENGVSYLFAASGKDKISLISACDAGVSGVVDLSSSEWSSLVYACFKKATKLDLRLGSWINQANVTVSVENSIVFKDDLKRFLNHVKIVNNSENLGDRKLYIGVITTDPTEDAQLIADVEELESLGWTIQIVYEELLSFTVSEKTFVDTAGRVNQNSGADLWTKQGAVFVSGYVEKDEVVKVYHSDVGRVVDVDISKIRLKINSISNAVLQSSIRINACTTTNSEEDIISVLELIIDCNVVNSQEDVCEIYLMQDFVVSEEVQELAEAVYFMTQLEVHVPYYISRNKNGQWINPTIYFFIDTNEKNATKLYCVDTQKFFQTKDNYAYVIQGEEDKFEGERLFHISCLKRNEIEKIGFDSYGSWELPQNINLADFIDLKEFSLVAPTYEDKHIVFNNPNLEKVTIQECRDNLIQIEFPLPLYSNMMSIDMKKANTRPVGLRVSKIPNCKILNLEGYKVDVTEVFDIESCNIEEINLAGADFDGVIDCLLPHTTYFSASYSRTNYDDVESYMTRKTIQSMINFKHISFTPYIRSSEAYSNAIDSFYEARDNFNVVEGRILSIRSQYLTPSADDVMKLEALRAMGWEVLY